MIGGESLVLTKSGMKKVKDLGSSASIWDGEKFSSAKISKKKTGSATLYRSSIGHFYSNADQKMVYKGKTCKCKDMNCDICEPYFDEKKTKYNGQDILDGIMFGDGTYNKLKDRLYLIAGKDDDYENTEVKRFLKSTLPNPKKNKWEIWLVKTTIKPEDLVHTSKRTIPDRFVYGSKDKIASFLKGLYSANGSVTGGKVKLRMVSPHVRDEAKAMLLSLGIVSNTGVSKGGKRQYPNGIYEAKDSYDLVIMSDIDKFAKKVRFLQKYKNKKLDELAKKQRGNRKKSFSLKKDGSLSQALYEIKMSNDTGNFFLGGMTANDGREEK